jgi:hypothetical protein
MPKLNLNFFGEEVELEVPKDLASLREKISEKYLLSSSDAAEIILYFIKDNKKTYIINGNDFSKFQESNASTIYLDVNQNSKLYLNKASELEKDNQEKELKELNHKFNQFSKRKEKVEKVFEQELREINLKIMEMNKRKNEIINKKEIQLIKINKEKDLFEKKIYYLQKKLCLPLTVPIPEEEKPKQKEILLLESSPKKVTIPMFKTFKNNSRYESIKNLEINRRKEIQKCKTKAIVRFSEHQFDKKEKNNKIDFIPIFEKVNEVLSKEVEKVKEVAKEAIMKNKEKESQNEENIDEKEKLLKEKAKKEQIDKIIKITKETVGEINNLTKMVINQSNILIEQINNPEKKINIDSDDVVLKSSPNQVKKREAIHFGVSCDGCKMNPIRGNRYKCKGCEDFDYCESCYQKNKETHNHEFKIIEKPKSTRRLGHKNTKYCQRGIVHRNIRCEGCGLEPFVGWRYMCTICDDYNLCENCEQELAVRHNHPFIKVTYPSLMDSFNQCYLKMNYYVPKNIK